ncbi:hypothetical protein [Bacillus solitudinis]|uniref:hypothetical protein n=1 Tax=Bacillus solitudinis TaxID=2014074 RepID=UPI000C2390C9|nr:hypothetical protein [Bacillus solitudinis]
MKRTLKYILVAGLAITLVACGTVEENDEVNGTPEEEQVEEPANEDPEVVEEEPEEEPVEEEEPVQEEQEPSTSIELADEKEIDVVVEGEHEKRLAQFNRAPLGYAIYILQDYTLVSEEPNRDVIFSNYDEEFFTRITSNGANADVEQMKQNILDHAEGTLQEDADVPLDGVEYAIVEEVEMNGTKTTVVHTAKKYEEDVLSFTLFLPSKEAAEGIGPSMWAMLKTIE